MFECIYNLFSLLGFSSRSFSLGSSSKLKLDRKYDSKESHCFKVLNKHFPKIMCLVEKWLFFFSYCTSVFVFDFRIWKHVPEQISSVICSTQRDIVVNQKTKKAVQLSLLLGLSLELLGLDWRLPPLQIDNFSKCAI